MIMHAPAQPLELLLLSQGWRGFATAESLPIQDAEINPLLQTPAPASRDTAEKLKPASKTPTRDRDPATARAVLRDIPISAKKLAMWTDVLRRKHIDDAIVQCEMAHKKAAKICLKVGDLVYRMTERRTASHKQLMSPCMSCTCSDTHHALARAEWSTCICKKKQDNPQALGRRATWLFAMWWCLAKSVYHSAGAAISTGKCCQQSWLGR